MLEGEKVAKTENLKSALCGILEFEENEKKVCVLCSQLFAILHSHTQLTNHHTEVIQSYHFQTIIP